MLVEVIRPVKGSEGTLQPGEIVETGGWKWADKLLQRGFIRPVDGLDSPAPRRQKGA